MDFILDQHPWGIEGDLDHFIVGMPAPSDAGFHIIDKPGHTQFIARDRESAEKLVRWLKQITGALEAQLAAPPNMTSRLNPHREVLC